MRLLRVQARHWNHQVAVSMALLTASLPTRSAALCRSQGRPSPRQFDRERKHNGGTAFTCDVEQRGQITQLHRLRYWRQDLRSVDQLLCRLLLALSIDN